MLSALGRRVILIGIMVIAACSSQAKLGILRPAAPQTAVPLFSSASSFCSMIDNLATTYEGIATGQVDEPTAEAKLDALDASLPHVEPGAHARAVGRKDCPSSGNPPLEVVQVEILDGSQAGKTGFVVADDFVENDAGASIPVNATTTPAGYGVATTDTSNAKAGAHLEPSVGPSLDASAAVPDSMPAEPNNSVGGATNQQSGSQTGSQNLQSIVPSPPTEYVTDHEGALSDASRDALSETLHAYEMRTGHQIVVWIGDTTAGIPVDQWTLAAANKWGVGRKGFNDGAILFILMKDHTTRIDVGSGLNERLTNESAKAIIDRILLPDMQRGDVDGAVRGAVSAIIGQIDATP